MISGELKGLISTNALELGIDIGSVAVTVLAGYPGTRAALWHSRPAGREGGERRVSHLILDQQSMEQHTPRWNRSGFSSGTSENARGGPGQPSHRAGSYPGGRGGASFVAG